NINTIVETNKRVNHTHGVLGDAAVEEQSAATGEISRNVLEAAGELSKRSESQAGQVDNFLAQVRAM
ncbi:MAG: methyl-accepting chemotaxis protein, partial [Alphaproteobacteria bacterium]